MEMAANLSDLIEAAIRDAGELAPWAEANAVAIEDARVEAAVLRAKSGPLASELAYAVPVLRFANTDLPAMPLVQAVMSPPTHKLGACDRCGTTERSVLHRLWVPAPPAIVELAVCWRCRVALDWYGSATSTLVWS